jgi:hypothetical protein
MTTLRVPFTKAGTMMRHFESGGKATVLVDNAALAGASPSEVEVAWDEGPREAQLYAIAFDGLTREQDAVINAAIDALALALGATHTFSEPGVNGSVRREVSKAWHQLGP